ncbi:MAG: ABC transporter permease [Sneathiellaceae bacterium]
MTSPATAGRAAAASARRRRQLLLGRLALAAALLLGWDLLFRYLGPVYMAPPLAVLVRLAELAGNGQLLADLSVTLQACIAGFALGTAGGAALPLLLRLSPRLTRAVEPYVMASMGVPVFTLVPLLILWFGIDLLPKIIITAVMVFYIVFVGTFAGLRAIDGRLVAMARLVGASGTRVAREIYWNGILPYLFASLKLALPRALSATIVAEFLVADAGLGFYIENSRQQADTVGVFAGIVMVVALVLGADALLKLWERRALRWRPVDRQLNPVS